MGGSSNGISDCDRKNTFTHDVQTHKTTVGRSGDDVKGSQPNGTQNHHNLLDEVHNRENECTVNYSVQPEKIGVDSSENPIVPNLSRKKTKYRIHTNERWVEMVSSVVANKCRNNEKSKRYQRTTKTFLPVR